MMNNKISAILLASVLSTCPFLALAADKTTAETAAPPTAMPGVNQGSSSKANDDKANKKGEESSGGNSGAEPHETAKDAATSSDSEDLSNPPKP